MSSALVQAGELLDAGKAGEAVQLLEQARAGGGSPGLLALLGYALYHDNRIAEAHAVLAEGVSRFPADLSLQVAWARVRWMAGDGPAFADGFLAAIASRPGDIAMRVRCGDMLRLSGQAGRAEELLRAGLTLAPEDVQLGASLALLLDEMGRLEEALLVHRGVVHRAPEEPALRLNLAHTLLRLGRADAAMLEINPVREAFPALQLALTYQGMALKQLGDPRFARLFDYERHIQVFDIATPAGFSSVAELNAALAQHLRDRIDTVVAPLEQSLRGGVQGSQSLVPDDSPVVRAFFAAVVGPVRAYIATLGDHNAHPHEAQKAGAFSFSGACSELVGPGGFHLNHTRGAGWISAAYDVSLPADLGHGEQEGSMAFGEPRWPVPGVGVERRVQPGPGRLVLFPSYMWRGTSPLAAGERVTVLFDVAPA